MATYLFNCFDCDYTTNDGSNWRRHIHTKRHITRTKTSAKMGITGSVIPEHKIPISKNKFSCVCGKSYKFRNGLYQHKKQNISCSLSDDPSDDVPPEVQMDADVPLDPNESTTLPPTYSEMESFVEVMKQQMAQQHEQTKLVLEMVSKLEEVASSSASTPGSVHNTTNNTNNQFNLNVFLNEDCKNAINLSEFLDGIQLEFSDLDHTKTHTLEIGLRNIIVKALDRMGVTERPFHCTDKKRRTVYVKHNGEWARDGRDTNHCLLKEGIDVIQGKQINHIKEWVKTNPEYATAGPIQDEFVELARVCTERLTDAQTSRIIGDVVETTFVSKHPECIDMDNENELKN